jgi:tRNA-2-methylthio-N6-dimethylallyladenosine synthase
MIAGFCTETEEDHKGTLSLMEWAGYDFAYMFKYSERPGTKAARKYKDDVPEEVKTRRLNEIIALQKRISERSKKQDVGKVFEVLTEDFSKRSAENLSGRTSQNKVVVFPADGHRKGEYVNILVERCTPATLIRKIKDHPSSQYQDSPGKKKIKSNELDLAYSLWLKFHN